MNGHKAFILRDRTALIRPVIPDSYMGATSLVILLLCDDARKPARDGPPSFHSIIIHTYTIN